jgi:putative hemolysin
MGSIMHTPSTAVAIAGIIGMILVCLSALMAASEIAFFSIGHGEMAALREGTERADVRITALLDHPKYLLTTILIVNNILNIGVIIISYFIITGIFDFHDIDLGYITLRKEVFEFMLNVVVVTFFLVLFGEAIPKVYATHNKIKIARAVSGLFVLLTKLLYPINLILVRSTSGIERRFKRRNAEMDIAEINKAIEITTVDDHESRNDANMLKGIVHFGHLTVRQIMRQRMEVAAADIDWSYEELLRYVREMGYSRLPVYKENIDHISGVLYVKDLLEHLNQDDSYGWQKLVRDALYVPETKKIDDMLREFQESRKHLAIVVDEFGGTSGIITLEDIVEEVIGDIKDEFDESSDSNIRKLDESTYIVEGAMPIEDFARAIGTDVTTFDKVREDAETVGGLLLQLRGRIPKPGDEILHAPYQFRVLSIKHNRIEKVKLDIL